MRAMIKEKVLITLEMTTHEVAWLKGYLQNPMLSAKRMSSDVYNVAFDNAPEDEAPDTREMRHKIFSALPSESEIANYTGN